MTTAVFSFYSQLIRRLYRRDCQDPKWLDFMRRMITMIEGHGISTHSDPRPVEAWLHTH